MYIFLVTKQYEKTPIKREAPIADRLPSKDTPPDSPFSTGILLIKSYVVDFEKDPTSDAIESTKHPPIATIHMIKKSRFSVFPYKITNTVPIPPLIKICLNVLAEDLTVLVEIFLTTETIKIEK